MTSDTVAAGPAAPMSDRARRLLFLGCFISLIATSFGFVIRSFVIGDLQVEFGLSETQKGEILGVGLWPFAISIVLFSLIVDRIGYGKAMIFAFACHIASPLITVFATGYQALYWGQFILALGNGTVEAVINPVVATMYPKKKTTMLTILHAGWPGGIVLGGILTLLLGRGGSHVGGLTLWKLQALLILIPVAVYGVVLLLCKFPRSERVAAGVSYRHMLKENGAIGWLIAVYLILMAVNGTFGLEPIQVTGNFNLPNVWLTVVMVVLVLAYLAYARSLGRLMYIFLLLIMILLAITELGTDTWMQELRDPAMRKLGLKGGMILIYTAGIMMVLRFCIGPLERVLRPLGVLLMGSLFAAAGLYFLSSAEGAWLILIAATIYGIGQTYFWPVTLGLVAERFPKGGALTLNAIAGVGMLGVGIIGTPLLGYLQDTRIEENLQPRETLHSKLIAEKQQTSVLGKYRPLDVDKVENMQLKEKLYQKRDELLDEASEEIVQQAYFRLVYDPETEGVETQEQMVQAIREAGVVPTAEEHEMLDDRNQFVEGVRNEAREAAMKYIAILPVIMGVCYIILILYFKAKGGYKVVELPAEGEPADAQAPPSVEERREEEESGPTA